MVFIGPLGPIKTVICPVGPIKSIIGPGGQEWWFNNKIIALLSISKNCKNILLVTNPEGKNKIIAPQEIILAQATTRAGFSILARVVDHPGENFHSYNFY